MQQMPAILLELPQQMIFLARAGVAEPVALPSSVLSLIDTLSQLKQ